MKNERAAIEFKAAQGNRFAQRQLADLLAAEGRHDLAEFYRAKANGHPAFTPANFRASQHA